MRAMLACAFVLATACGSSPRVSTPFGCAEPSDGILSLDWTIDGQPPSMTSCSGIAKLTLFMTNRLCGEVEIDPVPCALDKFRYDELPEGEADVVLQGFDAHGVLKIAGSANVTLTAALPAAPTRVAMQAP